MFNNINPSLPTIVMGDFNEDLCEYAIPSAETLRLLNFMSDNGYSQIVNTATTDRSTLIDHVYCSRELDNAVIEVSDCYYSDYDIVLCSISL